MKASRNEETVITEEKRRTGKQSLTRYIMLGIVVIAAALGVTCLSECPDAGCQDPNQSGFRKIVSNVVGLRSNVVGLVKSKFEVGEEPPPIVENMSAEPVKAEEILNSVGNAAYIFSCRAGGGGDSLFPTNAFQMRDNLPPVVANCVEGCLNTPAVPLGGYICQYEVDPARTNFLCKALPANGYTGSVFAVRKDMNIFHVDGIICSSTNSVPQK